MKAAKVALVGAVAATSTLWAATGATAGTNTGGAPLPAGLVPVNILNINDFHGRIDTNGQGTLGKNFACTILTQRDALGANTLTLGAGDLIGASPFTSAVQQDAPTIDFLNAVGLDSSATGNHEYDRGFPDLVDRVIPRATFDYTAANVFVKGTTTPALKTHSLFMVGGLRVAVIGGVTADTPSLVSGDGISTIDIGDPVAGVNRVADELTDGDDANGEADVLIAEYHEGGPYNSTTGTLAQQLAVPVFAHLVNDTSPKVAAILQGHTHQAYVYDVPIPGGDPSSTRPVLQTGNYASTLGKVSLGIDPVTKAMVAYSASLVPVTAYTPTCEADARWQAASTIINDAVAFAAPLAAQKIGRVTATISRGVVNSAEDRSQESALSNLIAQQYVESVNAPGRLGGAEIGIMNPGGVRADLPFGTDGTITFAQAATIMPFGNTLKTADYTGAQFKQVLEEQWQPAGSARPYLQLGLSKNVTYTYDPTLPRGSRITSVTVNGAPLDPAGTYTVVSNSFLITTTGAPPDGFATLQQGTNYRDSGLVDQNAFMDWVKAKKVLSPSFKKRAVAVVATPVELVVGQASTFSVSGFDMMSTGAPHNATVRGTIGARRAWAPLATTLTATSALPVGFGEVAVTFTPRLRKFNEVVADAGLPATTTSVSTTLTLRFPDTATTVTIPVTLRK